MIIVDTLTSTQRDALTAAATGTLTVVVPTLAGASSFVPMAHMTITVNGVKLVEGVDWTAATSATATAEDIEDAINSATATTLCTAVATDAVVAITANTAGEAGNSISIGSNSPDYVLASGPTLHSGALPSDGALIYNSTTSTFQQYSGAAWASISALAFTPENVANKDATTSLGTSDTKYPSQKAVKTYADALPVVTVVAADPGSPTEGQVWYNTTSHLLKYQDNSGTKTVATV